MNRSMLIGVVAGIGVATAGGVAGFAMLGKKAPSDEQSAVEAEAAPVARAEQRVAAQPATPAEECWDEVVSETAEPRDRHAIAGTAIGAVVGGAIGKDVGDRDLTTAAGAAAGAFIGRKIQQEVQENRADERTTTTTVRRCAPAGSR
jgi:uncharacterized protein YcfJ